MHKVVTCLFLAAALSACGGGGGGDIGPILEPVPEEADRDVGGQPGDGVGNDPGTGNQSALVGTWQGICLESESKNDGSYEIETISFNNTGNAHLKANYWLNNQCSGNTSDRVEITGTYTVGSPNASGALPVTVDWTVEGQSSVQTYFVDAQTAGFLYFGEQADTIDLDEPFTRVGNDGAPDNGSDDQPGIDPGNGNGPDLGDGPENGGGSGSVGSAALIGSWQNQCQLDEQTPYYFSVSSTYAANGQYQESVLYWNNAQCQGNPVDQVDYIATYDVSSTGSPGIIEVDFDVEIEGTIQSVTMFIDTNTPDILYGGFSIDAIDYDTPSFRAGTQGNPGNVSNDAPGNDVGGDTGSPDLSALMGTWQSECTYESDVSLYMTRKLSFSANGQMSLYLGLWDNSQCQGAAYVEQTSPGRYVPGTQSSPGIIDLEVQVEIEGEVTSGNMYLDVQTPGYIFHGDYLDEIDYSIPYTKVN